MSLEISAASFLLWSLWESTAISFSVTEAYLRGKAIIPDILQNAGQLMHQHFPLIRCQGRGLAVGIQQGAEHSNLIFCKEDGTILDSIKHVSSAVSSVREVLPGRTYFIPATQEKLDPLTDSGEVFLEA